MDLSLDLLLGSETPLLSLNLILFEFDLFDFLIYWGSIRDSCLKKL